MKKIETWVTEAQTRAQRRKSPWNLLLAIVVIIMIGFVWISSCKFILYLPHDKAVPLGDITRGHDLQLIFVTIPLFFPSLAWGMLFGNTLMWLIPGARNTFETEARGHKGCSFTEAMSGLLKFAIVLSVIAIPIAVFASYKIRL
ncbi:MAG: hypothetical protein JXB04_04070 [Kiritimatiellae bacterium]|nr:hypothetical protein [Kiritimatiellia bacterium]